MELKANYEKLASQIVLQAVKDWKDYVKTIEKTKDWEEKQTLLTTQLCLMQTVDNITNPKQIEKLEKKIKNTTTQRKRLNHAIKKKKEIEKFFMSNWCYTLSGIDGKKIVTYLNTNKDKVLNLDLNIENID